MSNSNNVANGHVARSHRRARAITRAAQRDLRTPAEQLKLLDGRPGSSKRESARLEKASA